MTPPGSSGLKVSIPGLVSISATEIAPPPAWALQQRQLMRLMEEGALRMVEKYTSPEGIFYYADDVDDLYERFYNWGLFYALGADQALLHHALQSWNATNRAFGDPEGHPFFPWLLPQIHNEYYCLTVPPGETPTWTAGRRWVAEWHHQGEGNMAFYDFGVADPTLAENVRRARRFAAMFIGEDPQAPNYDPHHRVFRSPFPSSQGPLLHANLNHVQTWLHGGEPHLPGWTPKPMGVRASLYPVVPELELDWWENPERREEIVQLFEQIVLHGDVANSLAATALVANAYLYTGEEKYRRWVLDYVEAWLDRMRRNKGIMPDNVGPTGQIGENRQGQWWGGMYGWNHYQGYNVLFHGLVIAAECALLLSGDFGYLELLRSQVQVLLDQAITREDGQLLVPVRYGPHGWEDFQPIRMLELAHLYHASMDPQDYALITRVRAGDVERDWNHVEPSSEKNRQLDDGHQNRARFQYYDGRNPDWPEKILQAEYQMALAAFETIRREDSEAATLIAENRCPPNPVFTKGLTQVALGAPQSVYNGGLLRATLRYFDPDRARPGLPPDVAALVEALRSDGAGLHLVNLSPDETRTVVVQAGAFREHQFTAVRYLEKPLGSREERPPGERIVSLESPYFAVQLPPLTHIRMDLGMNRFGNRPSYAFPWHGDRVPVPGQP